MFVLDAKALSVHRYLLIMVWEVISESGDIEVLFSAGQHLLRKCGQVEKAELLIPANLKHRITAH